MRTRDFWLLIGLAACGQANTDGTPDPDATSDGASSSTAVFPLTVDSGDRYLVDANGAPFFLHGDSAWFLITSTTKSEAQEYLDNRRDKGFNAILVELIANKGWADNLPYNKAVTRRSRHRETLRRPTKRISRTPIG